MDARIEKYRREIDLLCRRLPPNRRIQIMEVCGTHTMAIARAGLRAMLPENLKLVSGPGCPVCVTDQSYIDRSVALSRQSGVIITTYGDMVRVPGRGGSLSEARSAGANVQVVVSVDQAVDMALENPKWQVVFLAVGFETTAPATALAVKRAKSEGIKNFSVLTAHKLVLPALRALLDGENVPIDGFLCPGHVSIILGYAAYEPIAHKYGVPCVVAGFEAAQVMAGVAGILEQVVAGKAESVSVYPVVHAQGNASALAILDKVFRPEDALWRAIGCIPASGMGLREDFAAFDAVNRFELPPVESYELSGCRCGEVITGRCHPSQCALFAKRCTPRDPVGPCMVSSEGACAAAYKYERRRS